MSETAVALFRKRVRGCGERVALRSLRAGGAPKDTALTWNQWVEAVREFAAALVVAGHESGEVVGVLAGNRMHWPIADLGILSAGMVSAGIYPTNAPPQVRHVLADSGATAVVVDTQEQLAKVLAVRGELPRLRTIICGELREPRDTASFRAHPMPPADADLIGWKEWLRRGRAALARPEILAVLEQRFQAASPEDTAVLIYTSGSTGEPKGACISHRYLLASAASIRDTLGLTEQDSTLSFLPYCHAGERVFGLYTRILCGMETGLVEDYTRLWEAAREFKPTLFGGLPRFYEKVFESLQAEREQAKGVERGQWEQVLELGRLRSLLRRTDAAVPAALEEECSARGHLCSPGCRSTSAGACDWRPRVEPHSQWRSPSSSTRSG